MRFLILIVVFCFGIPLLEKIDSFLVRQLPKSVYLTLRWLLVIPSATAFYSVIPWVFEWGSLWPIIALPGFVLGGVTMAPNNRLICAIPLGLFAVLIAASLVKSGFEESKPKRYICAALGAIGSIACVEWVRREKHDLWS